MGITHVGESPMGAAVLYAAMVYSGAWRLYKNRAVIALLVVPSVFIVVTSLFNPINHWYYTGAYNQMVYGTGTIIFSIWSYALFVIAAIFAARSRWDGATRGPMTWIVCMLPPLISDIIGNVIGNRLVTFSSVGFLLLVIGLFMHIWFWGAFSLHSHAASSVRAIEHTLYERDQAHIMGQLARYNNGRLVKLVDDISLAEQNLTSGFIGDLIDECSDIVAHVRSVIHGYSDIGKRDVGGVGGGVSGGTSGNTGDDVGGGTGDNTGGSVDVSVGGDAALTSGTGALSTMVPDASDGVAAEGEIAQDDHDDETEDPDVYLATLDYPVLVTDRMYQVSICNIAFSKLCPLIKRGENIHMWFKAYPQIEHVYGCGERHHTIDIPDDAGNPVTFDAYVGFLNDRHSRHITGRYILLAPAYLDDTPGFETGGGEYGDNLKEDLKRQVNSYKRINGILHEIHDTTGHTLVLIWALLKQAQKALPNEQAAREKLREAKRFANIALSDIESSTTDKMQSLTAFLGFFAASMKNAGLDVNLKFNGFESAEHAPLLATLMRICKEATTNSLKHGEATRLAIDVRFSHTGVSMTFVDNGGNGSDAPVKEGFGLSGMRASIAELGGTFGYENTPDGFKLELYVPVGN
jgi:two-component sensor histidine kinase